MKFIPEERELLWVAADREAGVELAPWFWSKTTCEEIAQRTADSSPVGQFMTGIPVVLIDSPVPRPGDIIHLHPINAQELFDLGGRELLQSRFKRHKFNPVK